MFCSICGCDIFTQDDDVVRVHSRPYVVHAKPALCIEALLRGGHTIPVTPRLTIAEEAALRRRIVGRGQS